MSKNYINIFVLLLLFVSVIFINGCGVSVKNDTGKKNAETAVKSKDADKINNSATRATIEIKTDSPADTVRVFYKNLRENRMRDAMFLTNLRPAIEGLTDTELKDLQVDFTNLSKLVPKEIAINGEIITGESATVTAKLPDNETGEVKIQQLNLRKENNIWVLQLVDEKAEAAVKREGNNYFFALRIETHQKEVEKTLEQLALAQTVFAAQNGGLFGDLPSLVQRGLLSPDLQTPESTGYNFSINLSDDKKNYKVNAVPAVYGKTGNLSFLLQTRKDKKPLLKSNDKKGEFIKG